MSATTPRETLQRLVREYQSKASTVTERAAADLDRYATGLAGLVAASKCVFQADKLLETEDFDELLLGVFCLGACCHEIEMAFNAEKTAAAMVAAAQKRKQDSAKGGVNSQILKDEEQVETVLMLYDKARPQYSSDNAAFLHVKRKLKSDYKIEMSVTTIYRRVVERKNLCNSDC